MADSSTEASRTCPQCGTGVHERQRRCTNCGASVDQLRRRMPRRTPLIAALTVAGLGVGAAVVAQAAVTDQASIQAAAPPETAAAPVPAELAPLPEATRPTSTAPKADDSPALDPGFELPPTTDLPPVELPPEPATPNPPDPTPVPDDTPSDPDDLEPENVIAVQRAVNYDPVNRVGVEFGRPEAAIDTRSRTVWDVNVPADGEPINVGIILDLGETKRVRELRIGTPTPGFGASIARSEEKVIPPALDSEGWISSGDVERVSDDMTVPLTRAGDAKWARYIVIFLTTPPKQNATRVAISNLEVLP